MVITCDSHYISSLRGDNSNNKVNLNLLALLSQQFHSDGKKTTNVY